jgi:hypothetical protein
MVNVHVWLYDRAGHSIPHWEHGTVTLSRLPAVGEILDFADHFPDLTATYKVVSVAHFPIQSGVAGEVDAEEVWPAG